MHHSNRGLPTKPTFEDNEICENLKRHSGYGWGGADGPLTAWPAIPISTVQSLVITQKLLYLSSRRPADACNESIRKLRCAARVACCAFWEYWHRAMHFIIPGWPRIPWNSVAHS